MAKQTMSSVNGPRRPTLRDRPRMRLGLLLLVGVCSGLAAQTGARYLIVTHPNYLGAIQPLAQWKTQKGMKAKVVTTTETGATAIAIHDYIVSAYNTWSPRPEYVLIVGNPTQVPPSLKRTNFASDDWYGDVTGNFLVEIPVGRFWCRTPRDCSTMVAKTLYYEKEPLLSGDTLWMRKAQYIMRNDQGYINPAYILDYWTLRGAWLRAGFVKIDSLCGLLVSGVWRGDSSREVRLGINEGRGMVVYRGSTTANWWVPFNQVSPFTLTNTNKTPVIISGSCYTVSLSTATPYISDSFMRAGSRTNRIGAVAYFGTTSTGAATQRSYVVRGTYVGLLDSLRYRLGDACRLGKLMFQRSNPTDTTHYREWNLLGDPELPVWTATPHAMQVQHDSALQTGYDTLAFTITSQGMAVCSALVCARDTLGNYQYQYCTSTGTACFGFNSAKPGLIEVTITARDCLPWVDTVPVGLPDVSTRAIVVPSVGADSGTAVTPRVRIANLGPRPAGFDAGLTIDDGYSSQVSAVLPPGVESVFVFDPWLPLARGPRVVKCSTRFALDGNPGNNRVVSSVLVRVPDAVAVSIDAPTATVIRRFPVTPRATVRNDGNVTATFDARFSISDGYVSTRTANGLAPGASTQLTFDTWIPDTMGQLETRCTTLLAGDLVPVNDGCAGGVNVSVLDVGTVAIVRPPGSIPPGTLAPEALVRNYGLNRDPVVVTFAIPAAFYMHSCTLSQGLPPGIDTAVTFPVWDATPGSFLARCSTGMSGDQNPADDVVETPFVVCHLDPAVLSIITPTGEIDSAVPVAPAARMANFGDAAVSFQAFFRIVDDGGSTLLFDSANVANLAGGDSTAVSFSSWPWPHALGRYSTRCSVYAAGDGNPANDVLGGEFEIVYRPVTAGWAARPPVPEGRKGKKVKDGGCLGGDAQTVYALKGNNTYEFFAYNVAERVWSTPDSIPAIGRAGKKKAVKKGAAMAGVADGALATKGNGTVEWWRFDANSGDWSQLVDIPLGARAVKEGCGAVAVRVGDSAWVYVLKGSATQEFYRYNVPADRWEARASAPLGASGKTWKNGSCLTADPDGLTLYALKGSFNEFFRYDIATDNWQARALLPLLGSSGKKKKAKDGAGLAGLDDRVYALKGGNTDEFWSYRADSDRWEQLADVPAGSRKVKGGGALVASGSMLHALRGNATLEFFCYTPVVGARPPAEYPNPEFAGQGAGGAPTPGFRVTAGFAGVARVGFTLSRAGRVSLEMYSVTGELVRTLLAGRRPAGSHEIAVELSELVRGVYLLRLETESGASAVKLVCE